MKLFCNFKIKNYLNMYIKYWNIKH
jgi:hypothetical protein